MSTSLLSVRSLRVTSRTRAGHVDLVRDATFEVARGETLAVLGESGSGKTLTAHAVMGILESPPLHVTGGQVLFDGRDLVGLPETSMRAIRGSGIAMVFQDALSALNPLFTVGFQIAELFRKRAGLSRRESRDRAAELLDLVELPGGRDRLRSYPHELSGGMRQRVMIAMALALDPDLLIADEPTTALDVTVQAQIMDLLAAICRERAMALVLITHDLGVVADYADRIVVMYAGRVIETLPTEALFTASAHPYSQALLASMPSTTGTEADLHTIRGAPPDPRHIGPGCAFAPRCDRATRECHQTLPPTVTVEPRHTSACLHALDPVAHA